MESEMTYHLLWNEKTNVLRIDNRLHDGWVVEKSTKANSWLEAKKKLCFKLTPFQQELLDAKNDSAEISRRVIQHLQDAWTELRPADGRVQDWLEALEAPGVDL